MAQHQLETFQRERRHFRVDEQTLCDEFFAGFPQEQVGEKRSRWRADAAIQAPAPMEKPPRFILKRERMKIDFGAGDDLLHGASSPNDHLCLSKHITHSRDGTRPVL